MPIRLPRALAALSVLVGSSAFCAENAGGAADPFWPANGVFPGKGRTSSWAGFRQLNVERRTLFASRRQEDRGALVFAGDSLTQGWSTLEQDFAHLRVKVANRGIGGDTTPNLLHRFKQDVLDLKPRGLVVLIGANDLGEHTSPADIAINLREMLRRVRERYPRLPVAWCLIMPREPDQGYPERVRELNALIRAMAPKDRRLTIVDTYAPLALPDGSSRPECFQPDRLHLNEAGYAAWRDAVRPVVDGWKLR